MANSLACSCRMSSWGPSKIKGALYSYDVFYCWFAYTIFWILITLALSNWVFMGALGHCTKIFFCFAWFWPYHLFSNVLPCVWDGLWAIRKSVWQCFAREKTYAFSILTAKECWARCLASSQNLCTLAECLLELLCSLNRMWLRRLFGGFNKCRSRALRLGHRHLAHRNRQMHGQRCWAWCFWLWILSPSPLLMKLCW